MQERRRGFATRAQEPRVPGVHQEPASVPIYQTATWRFDTSEEFADVISFRRGGYTYTRGYGNPTVDAFGSLMADLEETDSAVGFASGTAAIHAVLTTLARSGDRILASSELYGGTYAMMTKVLPRYGIEVRFVDPHNLAAVEEVLPGAALFYVETIANPIVTVADLEALARLCDAEGVPSVVDNTFASPYLCRPATLGCSYVVHSATKYIGGHGDLIGGVVCSPSEAMPALRETAIETGATMQPLEAWLCLRGLGTLALRMEQHSRTAQALATFLEGHPKVERVHYPGLASHQQHVIATRELDAFGGMLAVEIDGGVDAGARVADALELAWIAGSLGGPRTLVSHPASTTHRQLDPAARRSAGIADGLLRVSVGLEDADDLIADFADALEKA
ncbi:MAG: trans-sulfuration enzyme family protein [Actinomycetota bacterium]